MAASILEMTLFELAEALKSGEVEGEAVVEAYMRQISRYDPELRAYVAVDEGVSPPLSAAHSPAPIEGAPLAVKDNMCTRGMKTSCGSKMLRDYVPPYDATVVERLRHAGALIIGKTNMDEFAMGTSTENSAFFVSRNPWDRGRVPGGSSGGSAVAVAAREAAAALGSDTGGSVRCPASYCGTVGLKPTYGLVSRYGLISYANSLEQIGPLTRDVRDCALVMNLISGYDELDGTSLDVRREDYLSCLEGDVRGLKAGIPKDFFGEGTDPAVEREVWRGIHVLEGMGMEWGETEMPSLRYALPAYYLIAMSEASSNLARYDGIRYGFRAEDEGLDWTASYSRTRMGFGGEVKRRIIMGTFALSAGYYDEYYLKALKVRTLIRKDFERLFREYSVLITPTMPTTAFRIGEKVGDPLQMYMMDIDTVPINLAGVPAISVPCGFSGGLPVGMQIVGPPLGEGRILAVAKRVEEGLGLRQSLRPPL